MENKIKELSDDEIKKVLDEIEQFEILRNGDFEAVYVPPLDVSTLKDEVYTEWNFEANIPIDLDEQSYDAVVRMLYEMKKS